MSDFRTSLRVYFVYLGISKLVYIPISTHPVSLLSRKLPCRLNRNHIFRKPPHHSWTFYSQHTPPPKKKNNIHLKARWSPGPNVGVTNGPGGVQATNVVRQKPGMDPRWEAEFYRANRRFEQIDGKSP